MPFCHIVVLKLIHHSHYHDNSPNAINQALSDRQSDAHSWLLVIFCVQSHQLYRRPTERLDSTNYSISHGHATNSKNKVSP